MDDEPSKAARYFQSHEAVDRLTRALAEFEPDALDFDLGNDAMRLWSDYARTGNGAHVLELFLLFRRFDEPVPEFVLLVLEAMTARALQANDSREVATALQLLPAHGKGKLGTKTRADNDRKRGLILAVEMHLLSARFNPRAEKVDDLKLVRDLAEHWQLTPDTALRYWRAHRSKRKKRRIETPYS